MVQFDMYERSLQSILRCKQCSKPFDKASILEATLKRHGYYCRSRKNGSHVRARSCIACAKGKARCDNKRPKCSRCMDKAMECHYPAKKPKVTGPDIQQSHDVSDPRQHMSPSLRANLLSTENRQEASSDHGIILDTAPVIPHQRVTSFDEGVFLWNDSDLDFSDILGSQPDGQAVQDSSTESLSLVRHSTEPSTYQTAEEYQIISSPNVSIPPIPNYTIRRLVQRPTIRIGAQRVTSLILHTLKSYTLMMLRDNTLPPFIHPRLMSPYDENEHVEPLANCISLVHMISSRVQGSRKLFWKNVRLECERLCEEHLRLNQWELLAAIQALSIYILIRLDEGETDYNNFDFLLSATVTAISKQLAVIPSAYSELSNYDRRISWKDWIFEESKRRICVVFRVVNMLVWFEPAAMCGLKTDLVIAPLPAKKELWEANDEFTWKAESERDPGVQIAFGLAASGELVKLDKGQPYCTNTLPLPKSTGARSLSKSTGNWEEWCAGMDGFGGLVMLAASLIA